MLIYMNQKKSKEKTFRILYILIALLVVYDVAMLAQNVLGLRGILKIDLVYYEYLTGCAAEYIPVFVVLLGIAYNNSNRNLKKLGMVLSIFPTIALLLLWTNDFHHLFYIKYSTSLTDTISGPIFKLNAIYSYLCFGIGMISLVYVSLKRSGFFSIQTIFMFLGFFIPSIVNIMGASKIILLNVYVTPILFTVTAICFYIAIFKLKAFNIIPVASRTVMDTMSDGYVVISNDGTIADSNKTFQKKLKEVLEFRKEDSNLFEIFKKSELIYLPDLLEHIEETRKKNGVVTQEYHFENSKIDKYFEVDMHPIAARNNRQEYIATLLVLKDITQHKLDIQEIEEKQEIIVKQQQLVSIGELAGGVAHDINTPISAIKTGIVMLKTMSEQRTDAEKEILERMDSCATKIINIVNSMRNQIRNLGGTTNIKFKVSSVLNDIKTITYHEVKKNQSEVSIEIKDDVSVMGDPTKLGQVFTNLIVNAAQAYEEKGGKIQIIVSEMVGNHAFIQIIDYAGGIDEKVVPFVFKNILTTKGTAGTGLGLYLAYSVIKGEFNGEIDFHTQKGEGTTFNIKIPLAK